MHHCLEHQGGLYNSLFCGFYPILHSQAALALLDAQAGPQHCWKLAPVYAGADAADSQGLHLLDGLMLVVHFLSSCSDVWGELSLDSLASLFWILRWNHGVISKCWSVSFGEENVNVHQLHYNVMQGKVRGTKMAFLCLMLYPFWWWSACLSIKFRKKNVVWVPQSWVLAQWVKRLCLRVRKSASKLFTKSSVKAWPAEPVRFQEGVSTSLTTVQSKILSVSLTKQTRGIPVDGQKA